MINFTEKTVLITGASSGIGAEFAKQLHLLGADLVLVARRADLLSELSKSFNQARADSCKYLVKDLTSKEELQDLLKFINENRIDLLINNAGFGSFGEFEQLKLERELEMIALNVTAPVALLHAVLPQMQKRKSGYLIMVSSLVAFSPLPYMATYSATKSFEFVHAMAVRAELCASGISYLTLCPGPTATEFGGVARVPGQVTSMNRDSVQQVVSEALQALTKNRSYVVTGWQSKMIWLATRLVPVGLVTLIGKYLLKGSLPQRD